MTNKSRQKFKYLENEKRIQDEIKSIFHYFQRVPIKSDKTKIFLECQYPTLTQKHRFNTDEKLFESLYFASVFYILQDKNFLVT